MMPNLNINNIIFYETLKVADYFYLIIYSRYAFFNVKSFPLRIFEKVFKIDIYSRARRVCFGDLTIVTGIRKVAYDSAIADLRKLEKVGIKSFFYSLKKINSKVIFEKLYFTFLYERYEFYGLASQFAAESKQTEFEMHCNSLPFGVGKFSVGCKKLKVVKSFNLNRFEFFCSIVVSTIAIFPVYLLCFWVKMWTKNAQQFKNAIVCEVDHLSTYDMFQSLFKSYDNVYYVVSGHYVNGFTREEIEKYGLITTRISNTGWRNIINLPFEYFIFSLVNFNAISGFGLLYLDLVKTIVQGNLITIDAENSTYFTFEHLFPSKTLRNELLREKNIRSVFVCKNMYVINHYFHYEYRYNYDILCSSGACLESIYAKQKCQTSIFLPTGSYDSNTVLNKDDGFQERINQLTSFKGEAVSITILSTGVIDETYSEEFGLVMLARRLAEVPNVKVFIRQKPTRLTEKYSNFFVEKIGNCESIMLTHAEYQLSDFLNVTDLFLVANSSSAVDLCPAGAQFFSVDFLEEKDLYLWQTLVDGVHLSKETAFETIMNWVNDSPLGQRLAHQKRMQTLARLIAYQFSDFEAYKKNFINLLNPYLPKAEVKETLSK